MTARGGVRLLGLTGGIGTGKSTASRMFAEEGARVIDADALARRVVEPGRPALTEIRAAFGEEVIRPDGSLDREALGNLVFHDAVARERLNEIVHPRVAEEAAREIEAIRAREPGILIVYDVPLLFEAGLQDRVDAVAVVYVAREEQLRRLVSRDGLGEDQARARIAAQIDIEDKVRRADYVLDNRSSAEDLRAQVRALAGRLGRGAGAIGG